jgi:hypothetical protein
VSRCEQIDGAASGAHLYTPLQHSSRTILEHGHDASTRRRREVSECAHIRHGDVAPIHGLHQPVECVRAALAARRPRRGVRAHTEVKLVRQADVDQVDELSREGASDTEANAQARGHARISRRCRLRAAASPLSLLLPSAHSSLLTSFTVSSPSSSHRVRYTCRKCSFHSLTECRSGARSCRGAMSHQCVGSTIDRR